MARTGGCRTFERCEPYSQLPAWLRLFRRVFRPCRTAGEDPGPQVAPIASHNPGAAVAAEPCARLRRPTQIS